MSRKVHELQQVSRFLYFSQLILTNELVFFSELYHSIPYGQVPPTFSSFSNPRCLRCSNIPGWAPTFKGMMMVHNYTKERKLFLLYQQEQKKKVLEEKPYQKITCRLGFFLSFSEESRKKPQGFVLYAWLWLLTCF